MAPNYQPKVYREQGATAYSVDDGGELKVKSGGTINVYSGSTIAIQSGGILDVEAGGVIQIAGTAALPDANGYVYPYKGLREFCDTGPTTAAGGVSAYGVSIFSSALSSGGLFFPIAGVVPGVRKTIIKLAGVALDVRGNTSAGSTITFDSSGTTDCFIAFTSEFGAVGLLGHPDGMRWIVTSKAGASSALPTIRMTS